MFRRNHTLSLISGVSQGSASSTVPSTHNSGTKQQQRGTVQEW